MNSSRHLIVLFGAAVRPDGSPSPALARRIAFAEAAARRYVDAAIFCSGAKGEHGPSEARVMAAILGRTIDPARLHLDEESADTLQQVRAAAAYAKAHHYRQCLTCTDGYHQPRVRMLFALLGIRTRAVHLPHAGKRRYRARMGFREALALPYDLVAGTAAIVRKRQASRRAT